MAQRRRTLGLSASRCALKPAPFRYERAQDLGHALDLLADHGDEAVPLAGGQSLLPMLNLRLVRPAVVVDLNHVAGLDVIAPLPGGGLSVGARVRHRALDRDALVQLRAPLLARAAPWIAHPAIRHRGTFGGSLALGDPAAEWPACAIALEATLVLASRARGERRVPAAAFFRGLYDSDREPDELLLACELPPPAPGARIAFAEVARRHGDYAAAGIAMIASGTPGRDARVSVALFGVGDTPVRASAAAAVLAEAGDIDAAAQALIGEIEPRADLWYSAQAKRYLAMQLLRDAWREIGHG